jgi:hypothetical protein
MSLPATGFTAFPLATHEVLRCVSFAKLCARDRLVKEAAENWRCYQCRSPFSLALARSLSLSLWASRGGRPPPVVDRQSCCTSCCRRVSAAAVSLTFIRCEASSACRRERPRMVRTEMHTHGRGVSRWLLATDIPAVAGCWIYWRVPAPPRRAGGWLRGRRRGVAV